MGVTRSCVIPTCRTGADPEPGAYACAPCRLHLVRQLGEIETYLGIVTPAPSRGTTGRRKPGYGSTPPLRLDVVAMLDPRTEINGAGPDDVLDEVPNVWADLNGWVRVLYEEYTGDSPWLYIERHNLSAKCLLLLRGHIGWIIQQSWVDEFAGDITRVHGALRQACGDAPGQPLGRCLDQACGGEVFRRSDDPRDARLRCGRCGTSYDGFDLVRIRSAS